VWCRQVENLMNNIFHAIGTRQVDVFAAVRPHSAGQECSGDDCGACKVTPIVANVASQRRQGDAVGLTVLRRW
jgi:hypothetical protein